MSSAQQMGKRRRATVSVLGVMGVLGWMALLGAANVSGQQRPSKPAAKKASAHTAKQKRGLDIAKINDPNTKDSIAPGSQGDAVVRAAILLARLKFSPGEIGASYGDSLGLAMKAFQWASGLPATGNADAATWAALNDGQAKGRVEQKGNPAGQNPQPNNPQPSSAQQNPGAAANAQQNPSTASNVQQQSAALPVIVSYVISMEDVAGPFTRLPQIRGSDAGGRQMLAEARLPRLNYETSLQLLAEKFHSSPRLMAELNPGKRFDKAGVQINAPNVATTPPGPAASVVVEAALRSVTALDAEGKILAFYPATIGSEHDPLPVGNWTIAEVSWYPKFKYNPTLFWDAENKRPRATLPAGPKSPVGVVWIGLSKPHYGIHGTPGPANIGKTQSHGCIRLTNWDASELGNMVHAGTPAILK